MPTPRAGHAPPPGPRAVKRTGNLLLAAGAIVVSIVAGLAVVPLPPLLVVGAVIAATVCGVVLRHPYVGLVVYTIVFFVRPAELYPVLAPLRLERALGLLTLLAMFFLQFTSQRRLTIDRSRPTVFLLLLALACLISVPFSYWRFQSKEGLIEMGKILTFYILVVQLTDSRKKLRGLAVVFCVLVTYLATTSFRAYLAGDLVFAQGVDRAIGVTSAGGDPNHLGTTLAAALPLFALLSMDRALRLWRVPFALGTILVFFTMLVTGSRGAVLGAFGGLVALWLMSPRKILSGMLGLTVLISTFLILPEQYQHRYGTVTSSTLDASSEGRVNAWKAGVRMVLERPLNGVGVSAFAPAYYSQTGTWLQAHSVYVQVAAELGVPGAAFFLLFVGYSMRTKLRCVRLLRHREGWSTERAILTGLLAGQVVLLVTGIFGHSLMRRTWYLYGGMAVTMWRLLSVELTRDDGAASTGRLTSDGSGERA